MRRPALLALLAAGVALLLRRRRAEQPERDVWNQATTTPDLR